MVAQNAVRTYEVNQVFQFMKAFGYIERFVESNFFVLSYHLNIKATIQVQ